MTVRRHRRLPGPAQNRSLGRPDRSGAVGEGEYQCLMVPGAHGMVCDDPCDLAWQVKTKATEVIRLVVPAGKEIQSHKAKGEWVDEAAGSRSAWASADEAHHSPNPADPEVLLVCDDKAGLFELRPALLQRRGPVKRRVRPTKPKAAHLAHQVIVAPIHQHQAAIRTKDPAKLPECGPRRAKIVEAVGANHPVEALIGQR